MKSSTSKILAVLLNLSLVGSSFADVAMPGMAAPKGPDFLKALTPPSSVGYITDSYQGSTEKPLILIQDLHANYGVQKKINEMLKFLQPVIASGKAMTIGVEGAWGEVNLKPVTERTPAVREKLANFLLKEAEMSGMEYFATQSAQPVQIQGIENPSDYVVQVELYKKSVAARLKLANQLDTLRSTVNQSRGNAPRELKRLWRIEEEFRAGHIDIPALQKELGRSIANYGDAEAALEEAKVSIVEKRSGDQTFFLKNVIRADQELSLLSRLLRQQLTLEEVQYAAKRVPEMLAVVRALLPNENLNLWKDTINTAIDHYTVALLRDTPMAERAQQLAIAHPDGTVVIVTGGFHTDGISKYFKSKKISYVTMAPVVASHTSKDERAYLMRMLDLRVTQGAFVDGKTKVRPAVQTAQTVTALVAKSLPTSSWPNGPEVIGRVAGLIEAGNSDAEVRAALANEPVPAAAAELIEGLNSVDPRAGGTTVPPGFVARVLDGVKTFLGRGDAIQSIALEEGSKATDVTLGGENAPEGTQGNQGGKKIDPATGKMSAFGVGIGLAVASKERVGSILTNMNLDGMAAHATQNPHLANALSSGDPSSALVAGVVVAGAAIAGAVGYFGFTDKGKDKFRKAKQARFGLSA